MPHNITKYFKNNNVMNKVPQISTKLKKKLNKLTEEAQRKRKKKKKTGHMKDFSSGILASGLLFWGQQNRLMFLLP